MVLPAMAEPRTAGIDGWAWRRGHTYGTLVLVLVLERRRPVALLPNRRAETAAASLKAQPSAGAVGRDRAEAHAEGVREGAAQATQVADGWHLSRNLGEALIRVLEHHRGDLAMIDAALRESTTETVTCPRP